MLQMMMNMSLKFQEILSIPIKIKIRWGTLKHTIEQLKAKEKIWTERENMNHHIQEPLNKSHRTYQKI